MDGFGCGRNMPYDIGIYEIRKCLFTFLAKMRKNINYFNRQNYIKINMLGQRQFTRLLLTLLSLVAYIDFVYTNFYV